MKNKVYPFVIVILTFLLFITGTYTLLHYHFNYSSKEWFRESINNGDYVIVGEELGDTIFDGGSMVSISIFDDINHKHMLTFKTTVRNGGRDLTSENYSIAYTEEYIKINLIDLDDKSNSSYRFYFDDFKH